MYDKNEIYLFNLIKKYAVVVNIWLIMILV